MHLAELVFTFIAYQVASFTSWQYLRRNKPYWRTHMWAAIALVLHALTLARFDLQGGALILDFGGAFSLFAWQTMLLLWLFSLRGDFGILGVTMYPLAGAAALIAPFLPAGTPAVDSLSLSAQIHIVLSMLAYGLLTLGAMQSIMLAVQHRRLRHSPPEALSSTLPPIQTLEKQLFRLITAGFWLLGLAIVSGAVFINDLLGQHLVHKSALSVLAWLIFAILLWGRHRYGWRGRTASHYAIIGYTVLVLAYFGSKLVLEQMLGVHWY